MSKKARKKSMFSTPMKPEKYIQAKARSLPIHECIIDKDWKKNGLAPIVVSRKQPSGNFIVGAYMVDIFCLGLKDTMYYFNLSEMEYEMLVKEGLYATMHPKTCKYELAHNIIYGAIAYAEELGFKPNKDFSLTKYILEEDDEKVKLVNVEFGVKGKPIYMPGPFDDISHIIKTLKRSVGEGNFSIKGLPDGVYPKSLEEYVNYMERQEEELVLKDSIIGKLQPDINPDELTFVNFDIEFDQKLSEEDKYYNKKLGKDKITDLFRLVKEDPEKAIPELEQLVKLYPGYKVLHNYLGNAYLSAGRTEEAYAYFEYVYNRFPDYLFARVNYASTFLKKGDFKKVEAILDNKFNLNQLYPDRETFHVSEVLAIFSLSAEYFLLKGMPERAEPYIKIIRELRPDYKYLPYFDQLKDNSSVINKLQKLIEKEEKKLNKTKKVNK